MAVLTQDELKEAVKEWCQRRGLPAEASKITSEDITFDTIHKRGHQTVGASSDNYDFVARVRGFEMKPVGDPYR